MWVKKQVYLFKKWRMVVFQVTLRKIMEVFKIWKQMIKHKECIQPQNLLVAVGRG
jgi:hypothetical protein